MLFVFVEGGGADAVQLAARQRRLEQVGGVHGAVGLAGPDQGVHLVDEQDDAALGGGHFLQHGLEPLLEFAAIFGAGDHGTEIERQQLLVGQALRHVAIDDAQGEALDDRGFADAGLADQHRVVLGTAGEHLDGAADFLIAPDDRIELAVASGLRQITCVFLQGIVGVLRRRRIRCSALSQGFDGGIEVLRGDAGLLQDFASLAILFERERQQQALDGDEAVAGLFASLFSGIENARQRGIEIDLARAGAADFGASRKRGLCGLQGLPRIAAGTIDEARRQSFRIVEQNFQQMFGGELLVALAQGQRLGGLHETAGAVGVFVEIHRLLPRPMKAPVIRVPGGGPFPDYVGALIPV